MSSDNNNNYYYYTVIINLLEKCSIKCDSFQYSRSLYSASNSVTVKGTWIIRRYCVVHYTKRSIRLNKCLLHKQNINRFQYEHLKCALLYILQKQYNNSSTHEQISGCSDSSPQY